MEMTVGPRKLAKMMAYHPEVRAAVMKKGEQRAARARIYLKMHFYRGDSFIEVKQGKTDAHIILNDERGQKAAMTIEFGRQGGRVRADGVIVPPMPAVAPLRKAVGLL